MNVGPTVETCAGAQPAITSFQAGQLGEAEQICQKIIATKSNFFDAQYVLGIVLASQGKHDLALTSYNRALTVQPNHPDALSNRGNMLKELRRFDEALASYDRALAAQARPRWRAQQPRRDPAHIAAA